MIYNSATVVAHTEISLAMLSQAVWTTTPRSRVNQELKLSITHFLLK